MGMPRNIYQEKWFPTDLSVVTPTAVDYKPDLENTNMWIPRIINKEHKNFTMSQVKGKQWSLILPQKGAQEHLFYPIMRQWGTDGVKIIFGPN